jgi:hypothetical protein
MSQVARDEIARCRDAIEHGELASAIAALTLAYYAAGMWRQDGAPQRALMTDLAELRADLVGGLRSRSMKERKP